LSLARIAALTGTLVLHILAFALLWLNARVVPEQRLRSAITLELYQLEVRPPVGPPQSQAPPAIRVDETAVATPARRETIAPAPQVAAGEGVQEIEFRPPPPVSIDQQRANVAAEIARESAPLRRPFRGRSIDAMLPDGDKGMLPGFRPRTVDEPPSQLMRKFGQMLSQGVPSAAVDPDAPMDLLTEGWEAKHHGSDLAACELQYEELDPDLRRKMCGEVGPGL
jgi:hypothetical protein